MPMMEEMQMATEEANLVEPAAALIPTDAAAAATAAQEAAAGGIAGVGASIEEKALTAAATAG